MDKGEWSARAVLSTLYARGGGPSGSPAVGRRHWPKVLGLVRLLDLGLGEVAVALRQRGLGAEASFLDIPGALAAGEDRLVGGHVVTAACPSYPASWLKNLGSGAPPCLWCSGPLPPGPWVGVVGSRALSEVGFATASRLGLACSGAGVALVSGGASGADRAAVLGFLGASGAGGCGSDPCSVGPKNGHLGANVQPGTPGFCPAVEIWPSGLDWGLAHRSRPAGVTLLSAGEPWAPFSAAGAMERNLLIYASASATFVVEPRYQVGGTWRGAVEALRRLRANVWVANSGDQACLALGHLGAKLFCGPGGDPSAGIGPDLVARAMAEPCHPPQLSLFGESVVRERVTSFGFGAVVSGSGAPVPQTGPWL